MASTILADNGVSSGSAGLKESADSTGVLVLQTTTAGGTATNALYIDTSQNVGLGVTPAAKFNIGSGGAMRLNRTDNAIYGDISYVAATGFLLNDANADGYTYQQSGVTKLRIDSSGNLGVGTTSPANLGAGQTALDIGAASGKTANIYLHANGTTGSTSGFALQQDASLNSYVWNYSNAPLIFATNNTERARIDSSGNLMVGTTSAGTDKVRFASAGLTANQLGLLSTDDTSGNGFIIFRNSTAGGIGSVSRVGTTNAVVYNTTSDYRLKTVIGAVSGAGERIDALKPIDYQWTEGGQQARGFLAHEFKEVYPNSVTGEKDAIDVDGNPVYQAMQASTPEVIADLVAEIKSLRQRIAVLENK